MAEGTKIGEFEQEEDFNVAVRSESQPSPEFKATKIGEMSDFEKSLYDEDQDNNDDSDETPVRIKNQQQTDTATDTAEAKPEKKQAPAAKEATGRPENRGDSSFFEKELDRLVMDYQEGDIIKGTVRRIEKGGVLVDINYKSDGYILNSEFSNDPDETPENTLKPGDEVNVFIMNLESKEGYTILSRKRAEYELAWGTIANAAKNRETIEVKVTSKVEGGLVADFKGIKGFIPASQVQRDPSDNLDSLINEKLPVTVLKSDRRRRKVIFSHKMAKAKVHKEDADKLMEDIEVGQVREGRVTSIKDFGVFVDLGGIEGLIHISELSWSRIGHPSEMLHVGDKVKVFVLGVDKESKRISLGMKQLEPDPWVHVIEKYKINDIVHGTISRIAAFGAFIRLSDNLEGLIHISELSYDHVKKVEDVVSVGDEVQARIIKLLPDEQRIGLSLKGVNNPHINNRETPTDEEQLQEKAPEAEKTGNEPAQEKSQAADMAEDTVEVNK